MHALRRAASWLVTVAMILAVGSSIGIADASTRSKPVVLTEDEAQSVLLTLDDVPSGWIVVSANPHIGSGFCGAPSAQERAGLAGMTAMASIELAGDQNYGPSVGNDVYVFPSSVGAKQFVQRSARAVVTCRHWDHTDPYNGSSISTDVSSSSLPQLADGVFAFHEEFAVTSSDGEQTKHGMSDVAYLRRGNTVLVIGLDATTSDRDLLVTLLRTGLRRLTSTVKTVQAGGIASPPSTTSSMPSTAACTQTVANLSSPAPGGGPDPVVLIRTGTLAALPVPQAASEHITGIDRFDTADNYLDRTPVIDDAAWYDALTRNGFVIAEATGYDGSFGMYGAEALQFGSPEQATDFQQRTLTVTCASETVEHIEPVSDLPAAVVYRSTKRGLSPYRLSMVIGSDVVHLNMCACADVDDYYALLRSWAHAVATQLAPPPAT